MFAELRGIVLKTSGLADVLRTALAPLAAQIEHAFVFGSVAKQTDTAQLLSVLCSGCAVVAVADAAVTVVATTVKVGATVVGGVVDVGAAGIRAVAASDEQ